MQLELCSRHLLENVKGSFNTLSSNAKTNKSAIIGTLGAGFVAKTLAKGFGQSTLAKLGPSASDCDKNIGK